MPGWEREEVRVIKRYVHPKMEIQSLSTYSHVSGRSGEVSWSTNISGASKQKEQCCSILLNNSSRWGLVLTCNNKTKHAVAPYSLMAYLRSLQALRSQQLQLLKRMLQLCFTVKLQKGFVHHETSPNLWLVCRWVDNDCVYIFSGLTGLSFQQVRVTRHKPTTHDLNPPLFSADPVKRFEKWQTKTLRRSLNAL